MSDVKALIERVEAASGPDRDLDIAIERALLPDSKFIGLCDADPEKYEITYGEGEHYWSVSINAGGFSANWPLPKRTASLDASIALVERVTPDWWIEGLGEKRTPIKLVHDVHEPTGKWFARLQHWEGGRLKEAEATTLPLAVLLALLRAIANTEKAKP